MFTKNRLEETRAPRQVRHIEFQWRGQAHAVDVKPYTWGVEKVLVRECLKENGGLDVTEFVERGLGLVVENCTSPISGIDLQAQDPDFIWTVAAKAGLIDQARRIGLKVLNGGGDDILHRVTLEYLLVEHRLRKTGYTLQELDKLDAEAVRKLYEVDEQERNEDMVAQAQVLATIIGGRMGL